MAMEIDRLIHKNLSTPGYIPIVGCGCFIGSLFFEWPHYCGSNGSCILSCLESGFVCCQQASKFDPRKDFVILDNYCRCGEHSSRELIRLRNQCFCFDFRCALPTNNDDVPCLINIGGLTLCRNWKKHISCCKKLHSLN